MNVNKMMWAVIASLALVACGEESRPVKPESMGDDLSDIDQQMSLGNVETVATQSVAELPAQEIRWDALIPADFDLYTEQDKIVAEYDVENMRDDTPEAAELYQRLQSISDRAPVVENLDGMTVKIPGFVVPLDYQETTVVRFLLVPYYGACIHTPPPPANQIIYVEPDEPIALDNLYDAIYATGTLRVEHQASELGVSGYRLVLDFVEPYL